MINHQRISKEEELKRMRSHKGIYKPKNPAKYRGNVNNIVYRSLLERTMMVYFDATPSVEWWSSEELIIPYISPLDNRQHKYYLDFVICIKKADGTIEEVLIEVKPDAQTREPTIKQTKTGKHTRRYIKEVSTWLVNKAKWEATEAYCAANNKTFKILTEKTIRPYNGNKPLYPGRRKRKTTKK